MLINPLGMERGKTIVFPFSIADGEGGRLKAGG